MRILDTNLLLGISDQYMLGEKSLPHVTLCQFTAEESVANSTWKSVSSALDIQCIGLSFEKFSYITVDNASRISLLPDNNEKLQQMHSTVLEHIKQPVKKTFNYYDPHMTLINTKDINCKNILDEIASSYVPIKDNFVLCLGESDTLGQMTKIISLVNLKSL